MRRCAIPSSIEGRVALAGHGSVGIVTYQARAAAGAAALILAHGAGAGQHSPFMVAAAAALAARGIQVITFNFPYTERRRRLPDRRPALESCYRAVIAHVQQSGTLDGPLFIGGKSMGGRIATHVAAGGGGSTAGVVLLGYPLHPPGKPHDTRDAQFASINCPTLFVQGSRDAFGSPAELAPALAKLGGPHDLYVVAGGDHSFKIARATAAAQQTALAAVWDAVAGWIAHGGAASPSRRK